MAALADPQTPRLAVGAIVVYDGDLLMVRRGHGPAAGRWSVPGGHVEAGELMAEAVLRELREETALEGLCGSLIGWTERIGDGSHHVILDFEVTVLDVNPLEPGDDAAEACWVPLGDVCDLDLVEGLAEFLHEHGVIDTIT